MRMGDRAEASARLRAAERAKPTYSEVGASITTLPAGYRHVRRSHDIGTGVASFHAAVERLLSWDVHRGAGLQVEATAPSATLGTTVLLRAQVGPFRFFAPCRVVTVLDEAHRQGFAYGTLPGHPELGEELFVVRMDDEGRVQLGITAFSRPSTWWGRLGHPIGRRVQDSITDRYIAAADQRA